MPKKQEVLRALTLWRPWPHAIFYGGKRIENRPWKPFNDVIGKFIAIHAGMKYDVGAAESMRVARLYDPPADEWCPSGCIVGVAQIIGYVHEDTAQDEFLYDPWFSGPYGWLLANVLPFDDPVYAKGRQGLWIVNGELKEKVRDAHRLTLKNASKESLVAF